MSTEPDRPDVLAIDKGVKRIVAEEMGSDIQNIHSATDIISDLGADPSDLESMRIAAEHKFLIKISEENWKRIKHVRDIVHLVDVYLEIKQIEM